MKGDVTSDGGRERVHGPFENGKAQRSTNLEVRRHREEHHGRRPNAHHAKKVVERRGRPAPRTEASIESHRTRSLYRLTQAEDGRIYATSGRAFPLGATASSSTATSDGRIASATRSPTS